VSLVRREPSELALRTSNDIQSYRFRLSLLQRSINRLLEMHVWSFTRLTPVEPDPLFQSSFDVFYLFRNRA